MPVKGVLPRSQFQTGKTFIKRTEETSPRQIAQSFLQIKSPSPIDVWRDAIRNHPDSALVTDLLHDIEYGVLIGFHGERYAAKCNNRRKM